MRHLSLLIYILCVTAILASCTKSGGNSYSSTDHTVGMIRSWAWSGTATGYYKGDTIRHAPPYDTTEPWPKVFSRTITDTPMSIDKINGFAVMMMGVVFKYVSTDSITNKNVIYDTLLSGASMSILSYYYAKDSMTFEYHTVTGYNAAANQYYQQNWLLHKAAGH